MIYKYFLLIALFFSVLYLIMRVRGGKKKRLLSDIIEIENYEGKYYTKKNRKDNYIISFQISQTESKIMGNIICRATGQDNNMNTLTIEGYVKYGSAYIKFKDSQNEIITQGVLNWKDNDLIFKQSHTSYILPEYVIFCKE